MVYDYHRIKDIFISDSIAYLGVTSNLGQVTLAYVLNRSLRGLFMSCISSITFNYVSFFILYLILTFINYKFIIGANYKFNLGYKIGVAIVINFTIIFYIALVLLGLSF